VRAHWSRWVERGRNALASFRTRVVLLVVLAALPALVFILYAAAEQRRQATEHARESTLRLVQIAVIEHEHLIEETRQLLGLLARVPEVAGDDAAACGAFLADLVEQYASRYTGFSVVERDGDISCVSSPLPVSVNVADRRYFRSVVGTGEFAVGEYMIGRISGEPTLAMAAPILDDQGRVRKVVSAVLSLDWLHRFVERLDLPPGGNLSLFDHDGTVLVEYPESVERVGRSLDPRLVAAIRAGPERGIVEWADAEGADRLHAFGRLSGPVGEDVHLKIGISKAVAFAEIDRTLRRTLTLLGLATVLAVLAAWVGSELFFLRRVAALLGATERVRAGDLSTRTGLPHGRGELARLAQAFDHMSATLEEQTAALKRQAVTQSFLARASSELARSIGYEETVQRVAEVAVPELADWCVLDVAVNGGRLQRAGCAHRDPEKAAGLRRLPRGCPADLVSGAGAEVPPRPQEPVVVRVPDDLSLEVVAPRVGCRSLLGKLGTGALMRLPLVARGHLQGVLLAVRAEPEAAWSEEERTVAEEFAYRAALAVDNARLYENAVEANRVKSDFLAVVSHELRTPLNAIAGYAQLMQQGIPVELPQPQREQLGRIQASTRHLTELIEEVLTFSRLEAGREEVRPERTDLAELTREVAGLIQPSFTTKGLPLRVDVPESSLWVETDPGKVRQILLNLLSNAAKFTDRGEAGVSMHADDDCVRIAVTDTGIGVHPASLEWIFEAFTQGDHGGQTRGGTGLGLAVSRNLARLLGGDLIAESEPGVGSRFELALPLRPGEGRRQRARTHRRRTRRSVRGRTPIDG
jgi:signal transduction histidine kinase/HAMP domain-containing protein